LNWVGALLDSALHGQALADHIATPLGAAVVN
jgi:hypothetical protein